MEMEPKEFWEDMNWGKENYIKILDAGNTGRKNWKNGR